MDYFNHVKIYYWDGTSNICCDFQKETIHEGYRYKSQPWWRCKDCSYRTKQKGDQVTATTGEHNQTLQPSYAQASANTVILSKRKQAQEQSTCTTNLSSGYTKLYSIAAMMNFSFHSPTFGLDIQNGNQHPLSQTEAGEAKFPLFQFHLNSYLVNVDKVKIESTLGATNALVKLS